VRTPYEFYPINTSGFASLPCPGYLAALELGYYRPCLSKAFAFSLHSDSHRRPRLDLPLLCLTELYNPFTKRLLMAQCSFGTPNTTLRLPLLQLRVGTVLLDPVAFAPDRPLNCRSHSPAKAHTSRLPVNFPRIGKLAINGAECEPHFRSARPTSTPAGRPFHLPSRLSPLLRRSPLAAEVLVA